MKALRSTPMDAHGKRPAAPIHGTGRFACGETPFIRQDTSIHHISTSIGKFVEERGQEGGCLIPVHIAPHKHERSSPLPHCSAREVALYKVRTRFGTEMIFVDTPSLEDEQFPLMSFS